MQEFDIIIIGNNITSLTLAHGLKNSGMKIAIIEYNLSENINDSKNKTTMFSVINNTSQKLLNYLGIWHNISKKLISTYNYVEIRRQNTFGYISFNANDYSLPHLGYIVDNSILYQSLYKTIKSNSNIIFFTNMIFDNIFYKENEICIIFKNKQIISAHLIIDADHHISWLRKQVDIPIIFWDYQYTLLYVEIHTEISNQYTFYQFFDKNSILFFLPSYVCNYYFMIWLLPKKKALKYINLNINLFEKKINIILNMRLGLCKVNNQRQMFPLICQFSQQFISQRIVLLGDSAYMIDLLYWQKLNLSFMDVAELIGEILYFYDLNKDIGQHLYLKRYERKRKYSSMLMLNNINMLRYLLIDDNYIQKIFHTINLIISKPPQIIKSILSDYILGINNIPQWFKKKII